jgi:PASTA domain
MPERWERELVRLNEVDAPVSTRSQIDEGPHGEGVPPPPGRSQRIVAGVVAFAVFGGAAALAYGGFGSDAEPVATTSPRSDAIVVTFEVRREQHPSASMSLGGRTIEPFGTSYCFEFDGGSICADTWAPEDYESINGPWDHTPVVAGAPLLVEGTAASVESSVLDEAFREIGSLPLAEGVGVIPDDRGRRFLVFHATWPGGDRFFYFPVKIVPLTETPSPDAPSSAQPPTPSPTVLASTIPVPDLVGLDVQAAMQALNDLGLTWIVGYREHPDVPAWEVVGQSPVPGSSVASGSSVRLEVATTIEPLPEGAADALSCDPDERAAFGGPNVRILPGGSAYIVGNIGGIELADDVVQITSTDRRYGDNGIWHVSRDGAVIAVVDFESLDGEACRDSGVGGV